jgi:TetR/AcrR family transcriptional regulator, regulator of biofilm formation and stress response
MIVADSRDRKRDMVLLAELYVLAIRDERYAELMRRWMRRYFLPQEFTEDVVRRTLYDLIPDANVTSDAGPPEETP